MPKDQLGAEGLDETRVELERRFQQAAKLAQRRKLDQALPLFESCLTLAAGAGLPLELEQATAILLELAFCHGDAGRWEQTFALYTRIEQILSQEPGWEQALPRDLELVVPTGYDPAPALAALCESRGIAYDNAGRPDEALHSYQRAVELAVRLGNIPKAASVWHHIALGRQQCQDWPALVQAAEEMLRLWTAARGIYGQIWAWQLLAQAHAAQGNLRQAVTTMELAVAAERATAHRDLARDEALLARLRQASARSPRGRAAALLRRLRRIRS